MKRILFACCCLALGAGCTVLKPFTGSMEKKAVARMQAEGWVESSVSKGMYGKPRADQPGRVEVANTPEDTARLVYGWEYTCLRGLEYSLDGGAVTLACTKGPDFVSKVSDWFSGSSDDSDEAKPDPNKTLYVRFDGNGNKYYVNYVGDTVPPSQVDVNGSDNTIVMERYVEETPAPEAAQ